MCSRYYSGFHTQPVMQLQFSFWYPTFLHRYWINILMRIEMMFYMILYKQTDSTDGRRDRQTAHFTAVISSDETLLCVSVDFMCHLLIISQNNKCHVGHNWSEENSSRRQKKKSEDSQGKIKCVCVSYRIMESKWMERYTRFSTHCTVFSVCVFGADKDREEHTLYLLKLHRKT